MSKINVWMPLYVADYLADTTRLTLEQHGAYLRLIMDYWRNGPPPDDETTIAQILGVTPDAWRLLALAVLPFFQRESGHLRHKRIDAELAEAKKRKATAVDRAQRAAAVRWGNDAPSNAPSSASSIPQALLERCPSPSPSPSPQPIELLPFSEKTPEKGRRRASRASALPCPFEQIVELYHAALPDNPQVADVHDKRKRQIEARWTHWAKRGKYGDPASVNEGLDFWRRFFEFVAKSPFLTGRDPGLNGRPFFADIDFLFRESAHISVIEGKYHDVHEAAA